MRRSRDLGSKFLVVFLLLLGLSILGYWVIQLSGGYLTEGSSTIKGDSLAIWHVVAEMLAGLLSVISAFLILAHNPLGLRLGFFTCGMLLYTGLNSIGWGALHDPGLLVLYIISSVGALLGFFSIIGREEL